MGFLSSVYNFELAGDNSFRDDRQLTTEKRKGGFTPSNLQPATFPPPILILCFLRAQE
jgi:hypothetical protein